MMPPLIEIVVALLLLASGVRRAGRRAGPVAAAGLLPAHARAGAGLHARRLVRHAGLDRPLLARARRGLALHVWLVIIVLSITAPVTTIVLARAALFRRRQAGDALPPPLLPRR